jgi:hypothetical protein
MMLPSKENNVRFELKELAQHLSHVGLGKHDLLDNRTPYVSRQCITSQFVEEIGW